MQEMENSNLDMHVPEGINYSCAGCGRCCHNIVVPMTDDDYERVSALPMEQLIPDYMGQRVFRPTKSHESEGTAYSHVILRNDAGHCPFLVDKLCTIHGKFGSEIKPLICQLFPYCFNETPTGIYVTVSFRSSAVLYNQGTPLDEQRDVLSDRLAKYKTLYPGKKPNWDRVRLSVSKDIDWPTYLEYEARMLEILSDAEGKSLDERLIEISEFLISKERDSASSTSSGATSDEPPAMKKLDRYLLVSLHRVYFPAQDKVSRALMSFSLPRFLYQLVFDSGKFKTAAKSFSLEELTAFPWPGDDEEIQSLLYRFLYSRIFGKWYFGGGYWQLSLITGFHHLVICMALLKLQSKASAIARGANRVEFIDVAHSVRRLEEQLSETEVNGNTAATFELLMASHGRLRRILHGI